MDDQCFKKKGTSFTLNYYAEDGAPFLSTLESDKSKQTSSCIDLKRYFISVRIDFTNKNFGYKCVISNQVSCQVTIREWPSPAQESSPR